MLSNRSDIDSLKVFLSDYLQNKHGVLDLKKPFTCLNLNHEDKNPSMSYTEKYNICKCFSCGVSYDIFDLIGIDYGVDSFSDKINILKNLYNVSDVHNTFKKSDNCIEIIDYSDYFKACERNISKTNYLENRGIDPELIKKYKIGYDEQKDMVIFPINKNCYFARGVSNNFKIKSKGISYLWNEELLNDDNELIYVTESIIDSLSLETIDKDVKTIALNGLPNYKRLINLIKEKTYNGYLVLAFDNDKTGLMYQNIVKEELTKLDVNSFSVTMISSFESDNCKDLNEALVFDKEALKKNYDYFNDNFKRIIKEKNREGEIVL